MSSSSRDPASNQLQQQAAAAAGTMKGNKKMLLLVSSNGAAVDSLTASMTAGASGPIVLQDFALLNHLSHFDRERIPERVVHAKGAGAMGYFQVTEKPDFIRSICKASLFQTARKKTPVSVRFSTVGGESGSADTARDPRGFAIKFFTDEGVWDLVGNNTPIFFLRDPILFPSFIHTQKRNPATHLKDPDAFWDFIGLRPETTHQVSFLFSDRWTPDGHRHMNGYGSHTFKNVNAAGEAVYVKYHLKTDQGIRNLNASTADQLASGDPDYAIRDLYNAIERGDYPSWTMYVQVMTYQQAAASPFNPFDLTKVWSHSDYPLHEVGRLFLNQNPMDYFAQVEQLAFSPSHLVAGVEPSPDKMLQARLFSYPDTHRHRLGANYQQLPCNSDPASRAGGVKCPYAPTTTGNYQRDGPMQMTANGAGAPNYYPNSFQGPSPADATAAAGRHVQWHADTGTGQVERVETGDEDNFTQAGHFFRNVLSSAGRDRLTDNIAGNLCHAQPFIRKRAIQNFGHADPVYGRMISEKVDAILLQRSDENKRAAAVGNRRPAPLNPPRLVTAGQDATTARSVCPHGYSSKL